MSDKYWKTPEFMNTVRTDYMNAHPEWKKIKRFKRPEKNGSNNKLMYALLYSYNVMPSELAEYLFVHNVTVKKWLAGMYKPHEHHQNKIADFLNIEASILFSEEAFRVADIPDIKLDNVERTYLQRSNKRYIVKKVLFGLMWVYGLTTRKVSIAIGVDTHTISRYIFTERMPKEDNPIAEKLIEFFNMPYEILFRNFEDIDIREKLKWYENL